MIYVLYGMGGLYAITKEMLCVYPIWIDTTVLFDPLSGLQMSYNSYPSGQNDRHFADNMFRYIFVNEEFCILIKISLKFLPKGIIDNNPALA